jgi:hypothetical protein
LSVRARRSAVAICLIAAAGSVTEARSQGAVQAEASSRIGSFLVHWREAWLASEADLHVISHRKGDPPYGMAGGQTRDWGEEFTPMGWVPRPSYPRLGTAGSCRLVAKEKVWSEPWPEVQFGNGRAIRSEIVDNLLCPTWYLGPKESGPPTQDVRLDDALSAPRRPAIRQARQALISSLDSASQKAPTDAFLVGQLVRFLLDQDDPDAARDRATRCTASPWWCQQLLGHVEHRAGRWEAAEAAFRRAYDMLAPEARCAWGSIELLLPPDQRARFRTLDCAERLRVTSWHWWLARPLWSEPGDARWTEDQSRRVLVALKRALPYDERHSWERYRGNDAREALVLRYGWPSLMFWGGLTNDSTTIDWGSRYTFKPAPPNCPCVSYEYTTGRTALAPEARAVFDPFSATAADWSLRAPPGSDSGLTRGKLWWPIEHFRAPFRIDSLPTPGAYYFRRNEAVLLSVVPMRSRGPDSTAVRLLLYSPAPDSVGVVDSLTRTDRRNLSGLIPDRPGVVGVEQRLDMTRDIHAARVRFGVRPPLSLQRDSSVTLDLSDVVLLERDLGPELDVAPSRISPDESRRRGAPLTIYWESYGPQPTDQLKVRVQLTRTNTMTAERRLFTRLGLVANPNAPVLVEWTEPALSSRSLLIERSPVPVIGTQLSIQTRDLRPGNYQIDVTVTTAAGLSTTRSLPLRIN